MKPFYLITEGGKVYEDVVEKIYSRKAGAISVAEYIHRNRYAIGYPIKVWHITKDKNPKCVYSINKND